nr:MAG TPA_asm: hypothetical protein [Caudoviricetes sp.]
MYIKVKRCNRLDCIVMICKDRATKKWCFVNLSTEHVCPCRFDTIDDAFADMKSRADVASFSVIENPFAYEQIVLRNGASLSKVVEKFRKNKEFLRRFSGNEGERR